MIYMSNKSISLFTALQSDGDFPSVRAISVLHQPHTLPSAHTQMPVCDRNGQRNAADHAFDVPRHIIGPLVVVLIEFFSLGSHSVQGLLHVLPDSGVCILVYAKTGRGVKQEDVAKTDFEFF